MTKRWARGIVRPLTGGRDFEARLASRVRARRRWRILVPAGGLVLALVVVALLLATRSLAPAPPAAAAPLGPFIPCTTASPPPPDPAGTAGGPGRAPEDATEERLSIAIDGGVPFAEQLRAAGVAPSEIFRLRRALEGVPGFGGVEQGRFVATRTRATGALVAFELRTLAGAYRGKMDGAGDLVAERTAAPPPVHLCTAAVTIDGTLSASVVASGFEPDLAPALALALGSNAEAALPEGTELRLIAREVEALGGFAGYDGIAALEMRPKDGASTRLYGVRGDVEMSYLDTEGKPRPSPAAQPSEAMLATYHAHKEALDRGLDAVAPAAEAEPPSSAEPLEVDPPPEEDPSEGEASDPAEMPVRREAPAYTVAQAAKVSCSTRIVAGLSRQVIAEARCLNADAFARVPARKNLRANSNVFLFLEAPARDQLLRALDQNPGRTMTINSALRTVAQQVLLSKWGETKRCGVKLAARPSESNHESGLAIDIREASAWRKALEAVGFKWMGRKDPVHFDYSGPRAVDHRGLDVRAFQRLWTRNHPRDPLAETGKLDDKTHRRLLESPAAGFPVGARCKN